MRRSCRLFAFLLAALLPMPALAQVAQIYASTPTEIYAFDAASDGRLTKVPGSPFQGGKNAALGSMAVNGQYLFVVNGNGTLGSVASNIDTWQMKSDGALKRVGTTNVSGLFTFFEGIGSIFLDHTGQTLYAGAFDGNTGAIYLSFKVEDKTGELKYTGQVGGFGDEAPLTFSANNLFAYAAVCNNVGLSLLGYNRLDDGVLTGGMADASFPLTSPSDGFCPSQAAAADPKNHVAFGFQELVQPGFIEPDGAAQLATYAADADGNLTTTSTYLNMPRVEVGGILSLSMSPSGKFLAVGGNLGLQIFHFNGAKPITRFTGLYNYVEAGNDDGVLASYWDNKDHLYAVFGDGHLRVYTVSPTRAVEAPGSPISFPNEEFTPPNFIVQVLPRFVP
jgi:hypothetical protein